MGKFQYEKNLQSISLTSASGDGVNEPNMLKNETMNVDATSPKSPGSHMPLWDNDDEDGIIGTDDVDVKIPTTKVSTSRKKSNSKGDADKTTASKDDKGNDSDNYSGDE